MEKSLVLQDCVKSDMWGNLEMYMLLTEQVLQIHANSEEFKNRDLRVLRPEYIAACKQFWFQRSERFYQANGWTPLDVKFPYRDYPDVFLRILMAKCPVSDRGICLITEILQERS